MGDPYASLDATAQADLVRAGEVTPAELVGAAIARAESLSSELNAIVLPRFDRAVDDAARVPGSSFRGVPFLTKDLGCPTAGEPQTEGMRFLKDAGYLATQTSHLARRFHDAGLVNLSRTNSPELGLVPTTEPDAWGATHNPWDLTRSPGGSSGGAAAAVAAGIVPVAHGSDGGGSIRIPASACGLVGLKPTRGRVSLGPGRGELTTFLSVQFTITRSVRDSAALLDVCTGAEPGDPMTAPPPGRPYSSCMNDEPSGLRVGIMTRAPEDSSVVDPECVAATEMAGHLLEALGHHVEVAHPEAYDDPTRGRLFGAIWAVNTAAQLAQWSAAIGRDITIDDVEPNTWAMAEMGRRLSAVDYVETVNASQMWSRAMASWWHGSETTPGFDLLLTPTLAQPPAPLGTFASTRDEPFVGAMRAGPYTPFTPAMNLTGQPAISLPLHWTPEGLPIGVHLVAAANREDLLLAVAAQLERAAPWSERRPPIHA